MVQQNTPFDLSRLDLPRPYLLFLGDAVEAGFAKTAFGLRDWAMDLCVGEFALPEATVTTGLNKLTPGDAYARGARALVIGVANGGGVILPNWIGSLVLALEAGLDIISGMHTSLRAVPELDAAADRLGRRLIDIRVPPSGISVASGKKRTGRRLLTVGTDCALGKKYTALALARELKMRGIETSFRATGQTGIVIAGGGLPIDAVVADFEAGAAELLSPDANPRHWDIIEGQGSLFHPAYAAVSLGLLHGSQPDVIVVCHQPGRMHLLGFPDYPIPSLAEAIDLNLRLGRRTNPAIRCGGVSLNTGDLDDAESARILDETALMIGLPAADPMRPGSRLDRLVDSCLGDTVP